MEVKEKPSSPPAISNTVLEEKSLLDFDNVLPHIGAQSGVYQKMPFALLAPSAATAEGYWWRIPECVDRTLGRRLVWALM
jgi:hypothetical protein